MRGQQNIEYFTAEKNNCNGGHLADEFYAFPESRRIPITQSLAASFIY